MGLYTKLAVVSLPLHDSTDQVSRNAWGNLSPHITTCNTEYCQQSISKIRQPSQEQNEMEGDRTGSLESPVAEVRKEEEEEKKNHHLSNVTRPES